MRTPAPRCRPVLWRALLRAMYPNQQWAPPPFKPKGIGCLGYGLIALTVLLVGGAGLCGILVAASKTTPEEKAENARLQAAHDEAEVARIAAFKEKIRAGCKLSKDAPVFVLEDDELRARCHVLVKESMPTSRTIATSS